MKKGKTGRKLSRMRDARRILLRDLAEALVVYERITTPEVKAKELRLFIEKLVTKAIKAEGAKRVAMQRMIRGKISEQSAKKLIEQIAPRYKSRPGGYTRIIKRDKKRGDAAATALIEFVNNEGSALPLANKKVAAKK